MRQIKKFPEIPTVTKLIQHGQINEEMCPGPITDQNTGSKWKYIPDIFPRKLKDSLMYKLLAKEVPHQFVNLIR